MDTNWYMKMLLADDRHNTLLAAADLRRLRQQARRPRWSLRPHRSEARTLRTSLRPDTAPERAAERTAARRTTAVPCTPTWHS